VSRVTASLAFLVALTPALALAQAGRGLASPAPGDPSPGRAAQETAQEPLETQDTREADPRAVDIPLPPGAAPAGDDAELRYPVPDDAALDEDEPAIRASSDEDEPTVRIPSRLTTRLRALDANLRALAARGGANIVNAVLSFVTAGLTITLGALSEPADDALSVYLYVYGGTMAARGVLDLVLTPNAQGASIAYQHMPMGDDDEVQARLAYGEEQLRVLAEQSLIARILDAGLNMAAGVAVVPIYLAASDLRFDQPLDYFILIGAAVSVVSGIITLASTSPAEQRWSAYQELRERLEREASEGDEPLPAEVDPSLAFDLSPTLGGGYGRVAVSF